MSDSGQDRGDIRVHLQMMQSVITRMADNSRACKTWAVTLVAAILVVVARFDGSPGDSAFEPEAALIALVPTFLFWLLDSYYLASERAFRQSYNRFVDRLNRGEVDELEVFKVAPTGSVPRGALSCQKSFAIWPFYLAIVLVIVAFRLLLN